MDASVAELPARWHKQFARRLADLRLITGADHDACFDRFDSDDFPYRLCGVVAMKTLGFVGR